MKKILKRLSIIALSFIIILFISLVLYSRNPYTALPEMTEAIEQVDDSNITFFEDSDEITYTVKNAKKNIIFIPGGLVTPDSYQYLALLIAKEGYNVMIAKAPFNLAILHPWIGKEFLSDELENVVIGHSLGGVTASNVFSGNDNVSQFILLGSYPISDISNMDVLFIEAEHDIAMNQEAFDDSMKYVSEENIITIEGGNHAQFGWYGPQKGDGEAEITTLEQHILVVEHIIEFIK